ncbi:unnamed protein product, partial [Thlaspi arvense]
SFSQIFDTTLRSIYKMLSTKSESNITSLVASSSSPTRSSKRDFYYTQSPSRDSSRASFIQPSPMDSPTHDSSSSLGRHSRNSSASKCSSDEKDWRHERKILLEEGTYYDEIDDVASIRRCQALLAVFSVVVIFIIFCFIVRGACLPYKAQISVQTFELHNFYVGQGTDFSGVPTKVLTSNGTLRFRIYNPAPTFGVHVTFTPINLFFYQLPIATAEKPLSIEEEPKDNGRKVMLYGAGASLEATDSGGKIPSKQGEMWSENWLEFGTQSESHANLTSMLLLLSPYRSRMVLAAIHDSYYIY